MIDLPPHMPVLPACVPALHESWRSAEACLSALGFEPIPPNAQIIRMEREYLALQDLATEPAYSAKADSLITGMLGSALSVSSPAEPKLPQAEFSIHSSDHSDETVRILRSVAGDVVFLYDADALTSLTYVAKQDWAEFDAFLTNAGQRFHKQQSKSQIAELIALIDMQDGAPYPFDDSGALVDPETEVAVLSFTRPITPSFEDYLQAKPQVSFAATYQIVRE
ncbi:hypothetical protein J7443_13690 [Tropicibacter sp. R15_0]|uniref:hypothetical protein n=1 Tax=Tropicibacter sp. R15_0 TaxID=2821101 RepID=UPI001ADA624D|nr:hypothetical protein [Tropicibacter sp. R15_0]MBO9466291.1 hypothetical protein [Tropicibacter sp. R15_0]